MRIGIATGVKQHLWDEAMIYPSQKNTKLILSDEQRRLLMLFYEPESRWPPIYGAVTPLHCPEDFQGLRDQAIEDQVTQIAGEMAGDDPEEP